MKGAQNTRMKDYYDLYQLCRQPLDTTKLQNSLLTVFSSRNLPVQKELDFSKPELELLDTAWANFRYNNALEDAPEEIQQVIGDLNRFLGNERTR